MTIDAAKITRLRKIASEACSAEIWGTDHPNVSPSLVLDILDELQKARIARDCARALLQETDEAWNRLCHGYRKVIAGKTVRGLKDLEWGVDYLRARVVTELERKGD